MKSINILGNLSRQDSIATLEETHALSQEKKSRCDSMNAKVAWPECSVRRVGIAQLHNHMSTNMVPCIEGQVCCA